MLIFSILFRFYRMSPNRSFSGRAGTYEDIAGFIIFRCGTTQEENNMELQYLSWGPTTCRKRGFMARTTGVSNPIRSSSFRLSLSMSAQQSAFAVGVLSDLYAFHRFTGNSLCPYRTPAW